MEARTQKTNLRSRQRARKSTRTTQGPLGGQWKLFERMIPALYWITLLFSFVSLGFFLYFWREFSYLAMAVGFIALSVALKAYAIAAAKSV